jgi:DNA-damage-inducible protein D
VASVQTKEGAPAMNENSEIAGGFEKAKKLTTKGVEYWHARDLFALLGYTDWRNFRSVIDKAMASCSGQGAKPSDHFVATNRMVSIGSGAMRESEDFFVSRLGCYLIAMNGDPSKAEIATAQGYFAIRTREQELTHQLASAKERILIRERIKEANKHLASTAKAAGVVKHGLFQHAGYVGLYGIGLADLKKRKGILPKEELLDRAGRLELSANEFRINLTEEALKKDGVSTESAARATHQRVGAKVRNTMREETGLLPENLPAEPSLKKLTAAQRKLSKKTAKKSSGDLPN